MKKTWLLLAFIMIVSVFAGCAQTSVLDDMQPNEKTVLTVDGAAIDQAEYAYYLTSVMANYEEFYSSYFGSAEGLWEDESMADVHVMILDEAKTTAIQTAIIRLLCQEYGLHLKSADLSNLEDGRTADIAQYESEDVWREELTKLGSSEATYDTLAKLSIYYTKLKEYMLSNKGPVTEEVIQQYYEDNYMLAKHILISTTDETTSLPLPASEIAEKKALAEQVLQELKDGGDFEALLKEYGEDPGMESPLYQSGYLFTADDDFVAAFIEGTQALTPGELSPELVETDYGYHIILRKPLETTIPEETYTAIADELFMKELDKHLESVEVKTTALFDEITLLNVSDYIS